MDASDLSDASFDRTDETDETDETFSPSRRLAASDGRRRIVDAAIRETVRDGLDLDLPREHEHHSLSSHHRSSLSLSEPSRSSFDSDASTATNDCARASSAPFYSRKPTRPATSSKRLSSTSSKRRPATSSKRRPATPSERLVASLETRLDSDLDARCLLARAEDEEDAADGSRSRRAPKSASRAPRRRASRVSLEGPPSAPTPRVRAADGKFRSPRELRARDSIPEVLRARSRTPRETRDVDGRRRRPSRRRRGAPSARRHATHAGRRGRPRVRVKKSPVSPYLFVCVCVCVCFLFSSGESAGIESVLTGARNASRRGESSSRGGCVGTRSCDLLEMRKYVTSHFVYVFS